VVAGAGVAAGGGGLLAVLLPGSPGAVGPGARQVAEAAYVVSRVQRAVSSSGQDVVGYARAVLPSASTWMPGAGPIGPGNASGARSPGVIGAAVSWWRGSVEVTTGFSPAGQRVLAARTAITAGGRVTTVVVNYRDRIWWQESSVAPAGQMRSVCSAQTAISSRDWPDFIHAELRCGQFRLAGRQRVDGVTTIEVSQRQGSVTLWVNAATYLPVRLVAGGPQRIQADFGWVRAAAQAPPGGLELPVPAGFREVQPRETTLALQGNTAAGQASPGRGPHSGAHAAGQRGTISLGAPVSIEGRASRGGPLDQLALSGGRWPARPGEIAVDPSSLAARVPLGGAVTAAGLAGRPALTVVGYAGSVARDENAWVTPGEIADLEKAGASAQAEMLYTFRDAATALQINADMAELTRALPAS
jgi:hypothetical protein